MKFKCANCHKTKPVDQLSYSSLDEAGVADPRRAVQVLRRDQLLCQTCEADGIDSPSWVAEFSSDYYQHEGLNARDRARRDAYLQSY